MAGYDETALREALAAVAAGRYVPDGPLAVLPQPSPRDAGVIAVTGHSIVFADVPAGWVRARLPDGDLSAPLNPPFLTALSARTGRRVNNVDMLLVGTALAGPPPVPLALAGADHPRAVRARRYRDEVRALRADGGLLVLGRGVAGRAEVAVEVEPDRRCAGLGRQLARAARHLAPAGTAVWAQVAPGNAASVRAFLAAGYRPVGAEALLVS